MANEFKHVSVGTDLSQAEWESTAGHVLNSQATGDVIYASSASQLTRLGIGSTNQALGVTGGIPAWQASSKSVLTTTGDVMYASAANVPARLGIGSTSQVLTVTGGVPTWATPSSSAFDAIQTSFRAGRKLLGEYSAFGVTMPEQSANTWIGVAGTGMMLVLQNSSYTVTVTGGNEAYTQMIGGGSAYYAAIGSLNAGGVTQWRTVTAPNKSPRMLLRWIPAPSVAALASTMAGFQSVADSNQPTNTVAGAYLRANTTGNLFFVTRQGASETTTDLGVRPTVLTSYEIETTDAGVTWTCRNDTTATVVATHTTNVPTAATGCAYSVMGYQTGAGSPVLVSVNYIRVEGSFTP